MNGRMDLVTRLRKVFNNSGKSQTEIAKKTNVTSAYIWKILHNDNVCPRDLFIKSVCKEFNVNEDWLRNGGSDDDMFVKLNEDEELAMYTQMLLDSTTDDVIANMIKKFICIYEKLDSDSKKILMNIADELIDKKKKE